VEPDRIGTVFGTEMLYGDMFELADLYQASVRDEQFCFDLYSAEFPNRMNPLWMLKNLPNMSACHVGIALDARGPNNTIVAGDASGLLALIEAARVIDRGAADLMVVGASSTRISITGWMYRGDINLSHRVEDPAAASRPFDADRDGMVNGEGAAALVIESRRSAEARGVPIVARLLAGRSTMAVGRDIASRRRAMEQAMHGCLLDATRQVTEIGHVNAHGLSTVAEDQAEAQAIRAVLGDVPLTAPKSYFGNIGAAGPVLELIASILGLDRDLIPPTMNYERPDPHCPVQVIHGVPAEGLRTNVIKLSYSTQGQTAAVLVGK
jgi:3-oxoacyl-[acyl-carrier-protein] synthase II